MIETKILEFFLIFPLFILITQFAERKWFADAQTRVGPVLIGARGLPQPVADFIGLIFKKNYSLPSKRTIYLTILICGWSASLLFLTPSTDIVARGEGSYSLFGILSFFIFQLVLQIIMGWNTTQEKQYLKIAKSQVLFLPASLGFFLVVLFVGIKSGEFNWTGVIKSQEGNIFNWGVFYLFPVGLIEFVAFCVSAMIMFRVSPLFDAPISDVLGGVDAIIIGLIQNLYFYFFSVFLVGMFLGGWNLPFGIKESSLPAVLIESLQWIWVLFKAAFVSVSIKVVLEPIAKMDVDQSLSLLWRYIIPGATLGVVIVGVYQWMAL